MTSLTDDFTFTLNVICFFCLFFPSAEHQPHFTDHRHHDPRYDAPAESGDQHESPAAHDYHHPDVPQPLTDNRLHVSADQRNPIVFHGPQYESLYDVDTPRVLYSHAEDELGHDESANSIASRVEDLPDDRSDERREMDDRSQAFASSSSAEPIMTETMNALRSSPFLSQYLSAVDSLMPSGFQSRVVQVYKDRKKKKK